VNVQRIQVELRQAAEHFPNIESYATTDGGIYIKAALQTSVGQVYIIMVTFTGYPFERPKVTVLTPPVQHVNHMYPGYICYMHPNMWNPAKHDLKFVLAQAAVWLNKHEVYKVRGVWPGPALPHTA
jgi:ubiquitin-protein ligase